MVFVLIQANSLAILESANTFWREKQNDWLLGLINHVELKVLECNVSARLPLPSWCNNVYCFYCLI